MSKWTPVCPVQDRRRWLYERKQGIGGSDAGALLGLSKWRTPLAVWIDKTTPEVADFEPTDDQRWGTLKEPLILQEYARQTNAKLELMGLIRSHKHPFMLASLDALAHPVTGELRVVDAKSTRSDTDWGEPGTDEVPAEYAAQAHHYMAVTGTLHVDFAVLIGSADFRIYTVDADPEVQAGIVDAEAAFWESVKTKTPPPPRTLEDAKLLFPRHTAGKVIEADETIMAHVVALRSAKQELFEYGELAEAIELALKTAMGDAEAVMRDHETLATWKTSKPKKNLDLAAIERDHPGLLDQYRVDGKAARPFLLKGAK